MKKTILLLLALTFSFCAVAQTFQSTDIKIRGDSIHLSYYAQLIIQTDSDEHIAYGVVRTNKGNIQHRHDIEVIKNDSVLAYCDSGKWVIRDTMRSIRALNAAIMIMYTEQQRAQIRYGALQAEFYVKPKKHKK